MSDSATTNPARSPALADHLELWILRLAKLRRRLFARGKAQYRDFYEDYFEEKDIEAYSLDPRMVLRRDTINKTLAAHLPPDASILDCGCGLGDVLAGVHSGNPHYRLSGFDFAQSNVDRAAKRLGDSADIRQGSLYEIPFPAESFDAAVCTEVLEHIEHDQRAIAEIARILKPGGILITSVPYAYYFPDYERLMGHFRHYTRESFTHRLAEAGLHVQQHLPNHPNWARRFVRAYTRVRIQHILLRPLTRGRSLYTYSLPWQRKPAMQLAADRLAPILRRDEALDYSTLDTSTFLLAKKPESAQGA